MWTLVKGDLVWKKKKIIATTIMLIPSSGILILSEKNSLECNKGTLKIVY